NAGLDHALDYEIGRRSEGRTIECAPKAANHIRVALIVLTKRDQDFITDLRNPNEPPSRCSTSGSHPAPRFELRQQRHAHLDSAKTECIEVVSHHARCYRKSFRLTLVISLRHPLNKSFRHAHLNPVAALEC